MRLFTTNAIFYIPILMGGLYMLGYGVADRFGFLSEKRRLKCPPLAYSLIGLGLIVVVAARLIDQAVSFRGDSLAIETANGRRNQ